MRVLVTGCSRGIGRATAGEFAKRGHTVIATARRTASLESLRATERRALDITDRAAVAALAEQVGAIDVLVNAAGGPLVACPGEAHPLDDVRELFEVNVFGPWSLIQAFLPGMRERRLGTIVNVSSVIGRVARPLRAAHSASKFALEGLSEALHYEVRHFGVRVLLVEPGGTQKEPGAEQMSWRQLAPAYGGLFDQHEAGDARLSAATPAQTADTVARAIVDAVEVDRERPAALRLRVGRDAETVLGARAANGDAEFESKMRALLAMTW